MVVIVREHIFSCGGEDTDFNPNFDNN